MTANIDIETAKKEGALLIPQRAIITRNGDKVVRIREGAADRDVVVKTGLRGSDGNIEIVSGLNEGDKVVISFE